MGFKSSYFVFRNLSEMEKIARLRAVSLFSWSVEQNARDTQRTTRVTEGARRERHDKREQSLFLLLGLPPSFLASRSFGAKRSRARALPLLNLKSIKSRANVSGTKY